jgi:hypothetical protein
MGDATEQWRKSIGSMTPGTRKGHAYIWPFLTTPVRIRPWVIACLVICFCLLEYSGKFDDDGRYDNRLSMDYIPGYSALSPLIQNTNTAYFARILIRSGDIAELPGPITDNNTPSQVTQEKRGPGRPSRKGDLVVGPNTCTMDRFLRSSQEDPDDLFLSVHATNTTIGSPPRQM